MLTESLTVVKYAKFKFNLKNVWFLIDFSGKGILMSWNKIWDTLPNTNRTSPANWNKETKGPLLNYATRTD